MRHKGLLSIAALTGLSMMACAIHPIGADNAAEQTAARRVKGCDEGNAGIKLPPGFCASLFADNIGHARHLTVAPNGDVYVNTHSSKSTMMKNAPGGYVVGLRDADRDGRAEVVERFGSPHKDGQAGGGTGILVHKNFLYVEDSGKIVRYQLIQEVLAPRGQPELILGGMPVDGDHGEHPFAIASDGTMYVNSGSASNACQEKNRTLESKGVKPCPELPTRAGIWKYDANKPGQTFSPDARFATGLRNVMALAVRPNDTALFATIHGRDQLHENWPKLFTEQQSTELPAEVLVRVSQGDDLGWPYCYFDAQQNKNMLAPEYGGDGKTEGECARIKKSEVSFPAHWAPNAMLFYSGTAFPESFRGGAFVSFHGSWNRKPVQSGFLVAFVPFQGGNPAAKYEEFATGFAGATMPADPKQAAYRPVGLAIGPDGSIYVSDDNKGRIWRITYVGAV